MGPSGAASLGAAARPGGRRAEDPRRGVGTGLAPTFSPVPPGCLRAAPPRPVPLPRVQLTCHVVLPSPVAPWSPPNSSQGCWQAFIYRIFT